MKPTKKQQEVLDLMHEGWELGSDMGWNPFAWLQKNGLGRGGATVKVSMATLHSLRDKGFIRLASTNYPLRRYELI